MLSVVVAAMNAAMTNGTDDDALSRVDAAASEAAMRNGMDNDALHKTLLLVGDMKDAVVVTSALFLRKFFLRFRKSFVVEGWILC